MITNNENNYNNYNNSNGNNDIITLNNNNIRIFDNNSQAKDKNQKNRRKINYENNNIDNSHYIDTEEKLKVKDNTTIKVDNFAEQNINVRSIIENALFSQLSEIKVFLLDFNEKVSQGLYNSKGKILPKIDYIELTLLNQGVSISELKKYGFGIYVFFLYLINLLVTFGILLIFALYYIYCIFFKYYQDLEVECSAFFECDILSLASGVQIKKFRKYYIETYGKEAFLAKYKNFDVIYKEYIVTGTVLFVIIFLINFMYILYLQKVYKIYKIENPEIINYTLILSGKNLPNVNLEEIKKDKNPSIIKERKAEVKKEILKLLDITDADINFTLKLSKFYETMDDFNEKRIERIELQDKLKKKFYIEFLPFCGICFCLCCKRSKLIEKERKIKEEIEELKKELNKIKDEEEIYNPLYIITFKKKEDYDKVYSKYQHSYLIHTIKNIFGKKENKENTIYINKAPNPEDIAWENLEFDKEHRYFKNKFINLLIGLIYVVISFLIQFFCEYIGNLIDNKVIQFFENIIISYILEKLDDKFSEAIDDMIN